MTVAGAVGESDGVGLDGNAALPLQVHRVEHLLGHLALGERAGLLEQAVGQRGLAMVNVCDDREIAYVAGVRHASLSRVIQTIEPAARWSPDFLPEPQSL